MLTIVKINPVFILVYGIKSLKRNFHILKISLYILFYMQISKLMVMVRKFPAINILKSQYFF